MCLVTSCSSCGIVTACCTNFIYLDSDKGQAQADTDVRTTAQHRMTTTHRLHDTGRHQRALSVHRRPPTVSNHLKSQSSCTAHPPASPIHYCCDDHKLRLFPPDNGIAIPGDQAGHHEGRRNFIHCLPLLKEFLYEMDRRKDTTQNPPGKILKGGTQFHPLFRSRTVQQICHRLCESSLSNFLSGIVPHPKYHETTGHTERDSARPFLL